MVTSGAPDLMLKGSIQFCMDMTKTANSIDFDEVAHHDPSHLDIHCLPSSFLNGDQAPLSAVVHLFWV